MDGVRYHNDNYLTGVNSLVAVNYMIMEDGMQQIQCNKCGKLIKMKNGIAHEDYLLVHKEWGYFSKKDGRTQEFIMCEECVKKLEEEFAVPSHWKNTIEML